MDNRILAVKNEVKRAIIGKDDVIDKVMTAIIAGGHILLEDIPGIQQGHGHALQESTVHS